MPAAADAVLEGYSHQRFPNLASKTNVEHARLAVTHTLESSKLDEHVLRAAALRLTCAYADAEDVLLGVAAEAEDEVRLVRPSLRREEQLLTRAELIESLDQLVEQAEVLSHAQIDEAGKSAGLRLEAGESPALLTWGSATPSDVNWYPRNGLAIFFNASNSQLTLLGDEATFCTKAASQLLAQLELLSLNFIAEPNATFLTSSGKLSLPNLTSSSGPHAELLSAYSAPFDASRAHLATEWLARNARERPDATAHELYDDPEADRRTLSYGELERKSNQLARWLVERGVEREDRVGICRGRDEWFYIAMAGVLKAGACYVPIDRDLPAERKSFIAKDSEAKLVLSNADHTGSEEAFAGKGIDLDSSSFASEMAKHDSAALEPIAELDGLAYILYTSGTSGNPKGCLQLHRGLYWAIEAMVAMPREVTVPDTDKRLAMAAVAFDVHISEIVQSWALGTCLVSVGSRLALLASLQENIEKFGITHIGMVPSMIEATLSKRPEQLPIKYMVSGGEKLTDAVLAKWAAHPDVLFANFYGPTEATIGCTARRVQGVQERRDNIGLPFDSCAAYVVDAELNVLPRGTPGELVVEGALIGRGYLNLPEVTKKAFVEWPSKGCRAYRTGDLVRMNYDGTIGIYGRIDSQVKLRGVRIESEGVSAVIREASQDPPIDAVTVVTSHSGVASELLITFIALNDGSFSATQRRGVPEFAALPAELMQTLREASTTGLASYMRPAYIVPCNFLPLSHNGKVDVKPLVKLFQEADVATLMQLQGSDEQDGEEEEEEDRAATEMEQSIIEIVKQLTGASAASLKPSRRLLEAGLSSLQFAMLTMRLRSEKGCTLSVAQVMSAGTIAACATLVEKSSSGDASDTAGAEAVESFAQEHKAEAEKLFGADVEAVLPPFPVQPGVLFQITQDPAHYVQHFFYEVREGVQKDALLQAWQDATKRHEMLRTCFVQTDAALLQVVLKPKAVQAPLESVEVAAASLASGKAFLEHFNAEQAKRIALQINDDLASPCWALHLFAAEAGAKPSFMSLSLNHAVYDAFAVAGLVTDVDAILARSAKLVDPLPLKSILAQIGDSTTDAHRDFWKEHLAPAINDDERASLRPKVGAKAQRTTHSFSGSFSDTQQRCGELGVTLQAFFYAVFALAGRKQFSWTQDAVFGTVRSGRNLPLDGIERAVCPLVTVVPMRVDMAQGSIASLLDDTQSALLSSLPHEHVPLGRIQGWLGVKSLFDVLFSCRQEQAQREYKAFKHLEGTPPSPEFVLAVEMLFNEEEDTIEARAAFTEELGSTDVEELLSELEGVAAALLGGDEKRVKLDGSKAKRQAVAPRRKRQEEGTEPDAEMLATIITAIAKFLQVDAAKVAPKSSLVSLGLTSLRAVALSRALQNEGINIDPVDIIQGDTPRAIAAKTGSGNASKEDTSAHVAALEKEVIAEIGLESLKLSSNDEPELALCTPLQAGMLSQTIGSDGVLYVHAFPLRLRDNVDVPRLHAAWQTAARAFDILRTSFHFASHSGRWAQVIHSTQAFELPWKSIKSEDDPAQLAKRAIKDLRLSDEASLRTPPVRLFEVTNDAGEKHLIVAMHHALYDGVSFSNLLGHVARIYDGQEAAKLPSFHQLARRIVGEEEKATSYWAERMSGCHTNFLGERGESNDDAAAWRASVELSAEEGQLLQRVARRYQVTPQSVGQLALAQALAQTSGRVDISFCQVVSGRTLQDAGEVVGPVFNTIPCRVQLESKLKAREALRQIHAANLASLKAQHASLRQVQRAIGVTSISDVLFVFQPNVAKDKMTNAPWSQVPRSSDADEGTTHFSLNVELHERADGFAVFSSCAAGVLSREGLEALLKRYKEALLEISQRPNGAVITPEAEQRAREQDEREGRTKQSNGHGAEESEEPVRAQQLTPAQEALRDLAAQILRVDANVLKPSTKVASLGLDSITAIQLASRARKAGIPLAPTDVVRARTVRDLLALASESAGDVGKKAEPTRSASEFKLPEALTAAALSHLEPSLREQADVYAATAGIEYAFAGWQHSGGRAFQTSVMRRSTQRLDEQRLRTAWTALASRHAVLRSTLAPTGDAMARLGLLVLREQGWQPSFSTAELTGKGDEEEEARAFARASLLSPPSIAEPQSKLILLRGRTVDFAIVQLPHWHYDGWSLPLLLADLTSLYSGKEVPVTSDLDLLLSSCAPTPSVEESQRAYWQRELEGFTPSLWPVKQASTSIVSHFFIEQRGCPLVKDLHACARRLEVSASSLVLASWAYVQSREGAATFGLVSAGRGGSEGLESLVAPCFNLVPLHVRLLQSATNGVANGSSPAAKAVVQAARTIQEHLLNRPKEVEQSRLSSVAEWVGRVNEPLLNVSVNLLFATQGREGDDKVKRDDSVWTPVQVPHQFSSEEQASASVPELYLGKDGSLTFPEIQLDLRLVVASTREPEPSLILLAEGAVERIAEKDAQSALGAWSALLAEVIQM